jgi:hypothetical protein
MTKKIIEKAEAVKEDLNNAYVSNIVKKEKLAKEEKEEKIKINN